jgi:plasmid stabilization system protein ParE
MRDYGFSDRARKDLAAITDWYAQQQTPDLANRFIDDLLLGLRVARERPMSCPVVRGNVRALHCSRFPYRIYFCAFDDRIDVLSVYHTARDPSKWDDPDRE